MQHTRTASFRDLHIRTSELVREAAAAGHDRFLAALSFRDRRQWALSRRRSLTMYLDSAIWTNDRHLLAAAVQFGIGGRSV